MGNRPPQCACGGDVLHHHADITRQAAARYLIACQHANQLALATCRVHGGYRNQFDFAGTAFSDCLCTRREGLRHCCLHSQQYTRSAGRAPHHPSAHDHVVRVFTQQAIIAGNIGLAFRTVQNQGVARDRQFFRAGESSAAHANDAALARALNDLPRVGLLPVDCRQRCDGALHAIHCNAHMHANDSRRMRQCPFADGKHRATGRRMHVGAAAIDGVAD